MDVEAVKAAVRKACYGAPEMVGDVTMYPRMVYDRGNCGTRIYLGHDDEGNVYYDVISEMDGWHTTKTSAAKIRWPLPRKGEGIGPFEDFEFELAGEKIYVLYMGAKDSVVLDVLVLKWDEDDSGWTEVEQPELYHRYDDVARDAQIHLAAREGIQRWRESP